MTTTQQTESPAKNKGGRPKKEKHGAMMWIPAELKETVQVLIQVQKQKQVK
jgi:hypothetical protein